MTKDKFFEELLSGATWSAGVAFKRSNPLPLDRYSVFSSYEEAEAYLGNAVCYPGQVIAVVESIKNADEEVTGIEATVYVVDVDLEGNFSLKEVGTKPIGDEASIEVGEDGKISLYGFEDAAAQTYPRKKEDGTIEWVTVQELVEGATENTITVGDAKSIVSEKTDTGYELSIAGYDEAEVGSAPIKNPNGSITWQEVLTTNGGTIDGDLDVQELVATSIVLGDKVISAKEDDSGVVGIQIDSDLIATEKHVADNYVSNDDYQEDYASLVEVANGKTNTYVVNSLTSSDSNFATLGKEDVVINGGYVLVDSKQTHPKIGDIYLIKDLAYVDRWVSAIDEANHTFTLSALETEKVDLNGYATEDYVNDAVKGFVKSVNDIEPDEVGNVHLTTDELYHGENGEPLADVIDFIQETAVFKDDNGQIAEDLKLADQNSLVLSSKGAGIKFRELDNSAEFSGLYSSGSYIYVGNADKTLNLLGEGDHATFNGEDLVLAGEVEVKQDKKLSQQVVYNREGNRSDDVETLLVNIGSEVASHDYQIESIQGTLGGLDSKYVQIPQNDEYVLKSVYDAHVEEFNALVEEVEAIEVPVLSVNGKVGEVKLTGSDILVNSEEGAPAIATVLSNLGTSLGNKEDKGKLTTNVTSTGNRDGVYYVPLTDKKLDSTGSANLVQLISGDDAHPLAVQMIDNGILLKAGTSGIVNINGNAATASVASALAESATVNVRQLVQTEGEELILNGGNA